MSAMRAGSRRGWREGGADRAGGMAGDGGLRTVGAMKAVSLGLQCLFDCFGNQVADDFDGDIIGWLT